MEHEQDIGLDHNPVDVYTMTEYDWSQLTEEEMRLVLEFTGILSINGDRGVSEEV